MFFEIPAKQTQTATLYIYPLATTEYGIGKLAYLLGADIVPVISHRDEKEINNISFYKKISISDFENKKDFPVKSIDCLKKN